MSSHECNRTIPAPEDIQRCCWMHFLERDLIYFTLPHKIKISFRISTKQIVERTMLRFQINTIPSEWRQQGNRSTENQRVLCRICCQILQANFGENRPMLSPPEALGTSSSVIQFSPVGSCSSEDPPCFRVGWRCQDVTKAKKLRSELKVWSRLRHECPLLGVAYNFGFHPAMIYPWVDGGVLTGFLTRQQDTSSCQKKLSLLNDIVLGLQYLHSKLILRVYSSVSLDHAELQRHEPATATQSFEAPSRAEELLEASKCCV
ncbi:hypothetical protein M405DRAFT_65768 [Rhizopogon salebrosus TDB-379]|nr:hypothetical protein M405DRAFT_65768 [Rhizopogon salebrosus TDB-379]